MLITDCGDPYTLAQIKHQYYLAKTNGVAGFASSSAVILDRVHQGALETIIIDRALFMSKS